MNRNHLLFPALIIPFLLLAPCLAQDPPSPRQSTPPQSPTAIISENQGDIPNTPLTRHDILRSNVQRIINSTRTPQSYGIFIKEADSPIAIVDHNANSGYNPVESQIILTSAAALHYLGSSYRFRTTITPYGKLVDGTLQGHLLIRANGDPTIGTTIYMESTPKKYDPFATFRQWASIIQEAGINTVAGALVMDDSVFDQELTRPGWPPDITGQALAAQVSPFSFRGNCVDIKLESGWFKRKKVSAEIFPGIYTTLYNGVLSASKGTPYDVTAKRRGDSNIIEVTGSIPVRSKYRVRASIHNPANYYGTLLRHTLQEEGIDIYRSKPILTSDLKNRDAFSSPTLPVVNHFSPKLSEYLPAVMRQQKYQPAEQLFKAIAFRYKRQGSFKAGAEAIEKMLKDIGVRNDGTFIRDGSGRSRRNALSPLALAHILSYMDKHADSEVFKAGFFKPGQGGPILKSLKVVDSLQDKLLAYEAEASSAVVFTGYITTAGGTKMVFAFMCEDPRVSIRESQVLFAQLLTMLADSGLEK
jgi:serine-type D-Ala-D-Ala carboxypeptidase/endopeptidase (penicillin-binding protein 4)